MKAKTEKLKNLYWNEFLRTHFECTGWIKQRVEEGIKLCESTIDDPRLQVRMHELLNSADFAIAMLKRFQKETIVGKSIKLEVHHRYAGLFKEINTAHSDIFALFLQALVEKLEELANRADKSKLAELARTLKEVHYFRAPDETKQAAANILWECRRAAYGAVSEKDLAGPMIAHWPYSDYKFTGPSAVIYLPPYDNTKLCHWAIFAHETFHSKLHTINKLLDNIERAKISKDNELKTRSIELLKKLLPTEAYDKLTELRSSLTRALKIRTGEEYRMLYQARVSDDFYIPYLFLDYQFQEILCDIAAIFVAGPSYLAVSSMATADSIRQPYLDVFRHIVFDPLHPPDICRAWYQIRALEDAAVGVKGKAVDSLKDSFWALLSSDLYGREKEEKEEHAEEFLKIYINTITDKKLWKDIFEIVDLFVDKNVRYSHERWKRVVSSYRRINKDHEAELKDMLPFDFVNMVWLKLAEISKEGLEYKDYCDAYKAEHKFFKNLWDRVRSLPIN